VEAHYRVPTVSDAIGGQQTVAMMDLRASTKRQNASTRDTLTWISFGQSSAQGMEVDETILF
jgi:hypothetical protein